MRSDTAPPTLVPGPRLAAGSRLRLSDLNHAERLVIRAIRAAASRPDSSDAIPVTEHDREEFHDLRRVVERYLHHHAPAASWHEDGEADLRLGIFELQTLHALACLQSGLLGEAWQSLVPVWGAAEAGQALVRLQEVAAALQSREHRVERWQFDATVCREAALI